MERLYSPWRSAYVTAARDEGPGCILCGIRDSRDDRSSLVLLRTPSSLVVINRYPYNSGHIMVVPLRHEASLRGLTPSERSDLVELAAGAEGILRETYRAQGINLGMNLGTPAGAGIDGHLHLHLVPRWVGDTNFMSVIGSTRVIPEENETTWDRLAPQFQEWAHTRGPRT